MLFNFNMTSLFIFTEHQTKITRKSSQGTYSITVRLLILSIATCQILGFVSSFHDCLSRKTNIKKHIDNIVFIVCDNRRSPMVALFRRARKKHLQFYVPPDVCFLTEHFTCKHKIF